MWTGWRHWLEQREAKAVEAAAAAATAEDDAEDRMSASLARLNDHLHSLSWRKWTIRVLLLAEGTAAWVAGTLPARLPTSSGHRPSRWHPS